MDIASEFMPTKVLNGAVQSIYIQIFKEEFNMITQNQNTYEGKKKRKAIAIVLCLTLALTLVIGSLFAYFSDMIDGTKEMTAGTLTITGGAEFFINDSTTAASDADLECINPGDEIKVVINVENTGSKSAWLQGSFGMSTELAKADLDKDFSVYVVEEVEDGEDITTLMDVSGDGHTASFTDGGDKIIDGDTEKETGDNAIGKTTTTMTYLIVFKETAGNEYQDATFEITYEVKAIQYRNNPTPNWDLAVKFGD